VRPLESGLYFTGAEVKDGWMPYVHLSLLALPGFFVENCHLPSLAGKTTDCWRTCLKTWAYYWRDAAAVVDALAWRRTNR